MCFKLWRLGFARLRNFTYSNKSCIIDFKEVGCLDWWWVSVYFLFYRSLSGDGCLYNTRLCCNSYWRGTSPEQCSTRNTTQNLIVLLFLGYKFLVSLDETCAD